MMKNKQLAFPKHIFDHVMVDGAPHDFHSLADAQPQPLANLQQSASYYQYMKFSMLLQQLTWASRCIILVAQLKSQQPKISNMLDLPHTSQNTLKTKSNMVSFRAFSVNTCLIGHHCCPENSHFIVAYSEFSGQPGLLSAQFQQHNWKFSSHRRLDHYVFHTLPYEKRKTNIKFYNLFLDDGVFSCFTGLISLFLEVWQIFK